MVFLIFYAIPIFGGIAFLASLTTFIQPRAAFLLRLLSLYLLLDCIVETYISYEALHRQNTQVINGLWSTVSFSFFTYLLRAIILGTKARRVLLYCLFVFPLICAVNIFLIQKYVYQSITYSLGCLLVVAASIYYFWELFQNKAYINLIREPTFWICSGLLFYCACSFPIYGFLNFVSDLAYEVIRVFVIIADLVNIFLYLSFTIAFLCRLRPRKSI